MKMNGYNKQKDAQRFFWYRKNQSHVVWRENKSINQKICNKRNGDMCINSIGIKKKKLLRENFFDSLNFKVQPNSLENLFFHCLTPR